MNTKIYKRVLSLTNELMVSVEQKNQKRFDGYYSELKELCEKNENTDKDHPVQWETLADFTDDLDLAVFFYKKALIKAEVINSKDFISSISFAIGSLQVELNNKVDAVKHLEKAKVNSNKIADKELKVEIDELLRSLINEHLL